MGAAAFAAGILLALDLVSLRTLLAEAGGTALVMPAAKLHARILLLFAHRGAQALELGLALAGLSLLLGAFVAGLRLGRPSGRS